MLRSRRHRIVFILSLALAFGSIGRAQPPEREVKIAVLSFGDNQTARRVTEQIARWVATRHSSVSQFRLVDRDLAAAATKGAGYDGSLNLTLEEARNLGAVIGAEFCFIGEADTLRRLRSTDEAYFESYASIFLVSARTGRLILWEKPVFKRPTPEDALKSLTEHLATAEMALRFKSAIQRALEIESAERAHAVERGIPVIEAMSDESPQAGDGPRPPRPFRRLKPPYSDAAAATQVEAVVDVLVDVDEKGEVGRIEIVRWAGYGLDESVMATVKQLHFFPAMRNGRPIPMRVLLRYNFRKPPLQAPQ